MKNTKYSWILPIYNEAQSLSRLLPEINQVMKGKNFEIIAINDGSEDNTLIILKSLTRSARGARRASHIPQLKIIHFPARQGKWAAILAGFKAATGPIVITSDSDLQDDPKEVTNLLKKLNLGFDLVSGARIKRFDPFYKVFISRLGNGLASILSGRHFKDLNSPFKVYRRQLVDQLPTQGSLLRFSMLLAIKLGYKVTEVPVNHRPRLYGKSKFGIIKYLRIIYDLILVLLLFSGSGKLRKINSKKLSKMQYKGREL